MVIIKLLCLGLQLFLATYSDSWAASEGVVGDTAVRD